MRDWYAGRGHGFYMPPIPPAAAAAVVWSAPLLPAMSPHWHLWEAHSITHPSLCLQLLPCVSRKPPQLRLHGHQRLWGWLLPVFKVSDEELVRSAGLDALIAVRSRAAGRQSCLVTVWHPEGRHFQALLMMAACRRVVHTFRGAVARPGYKRMALASHAGPHNQLWRHALSAHDNCCNGGAAAGQLHLWCVLETRTALHKLACLRWLRPPGC